MNKAEAIAAMEVGKTLTHMYFSGDESIKQVGCKYVFEDGILCSYSEFWRFRQEDYWNEGWSIINE